MAPVALPVASWSGRTGRGVRVAVVDSGIHAGHSHVGQVAAGVSIDAAGALQAEFVDRLGHGTAIAAAIREKAPDAELFAVRVFERELAATGRALVSAIEWAAAQKVALINLSLGTANQDHAPALAGAVALAAKSGAIVVAAAPQPEAAWLPGGLPGVVAVDADWDCDRATARAWLDDRGGVRMSASAYPRPIPGVPPERNFRGLSCAVANATGLLALALEGALPALGDEGQRLLRDRIDLR